MIEVAGLSKAYGGALVVDDVSFGCRRGTVTALVGPRFAGKTTMLRMITALTPPTSGTALIAGKRYADLPAPGRQVGVSLGATPVADGRSVHAVLTLTASALGVPRPRVPVVLEIVGLTSEHARVRLSHLDESGLHRFALARALLADPPVLVLDAPTLRAGTPVGDLSRRLVREQADRGGTVLLASRSGHDVQDLADQVLTLRRGRVVPDVDGQAVPRLPAAVT